MAVVAFSITVPASWPTCRATESKGGEEETSDATPRKAECFYSERGGDSVGIEVVASLDKHSGHQRCSNDINDASGLELDRIHWRCLQVRILKKRHFRDGSKGPII